MENMLTVCNALNDTNSKPKLVTLYQSDKYSTSQQYVVCDLYSVAPTQTNAYVTTMQHRFRPSCCHILTTLRKSPFGSLSLLRSMSGFASVGDSIQNFPPEQRHPQTVPHIKPLVSPPQIVRKINSVKRVRPGPENQHTSKKQH